MTCFLFQNDYFTLTMWPETAKGKLIGNICLVIGEVTDDMMDSLKNRDWKGMKNLKWSNVEGDSEEQLVERFGDHEKRVRDLTEKHFKVKVEQTDMHVMEI